MEKKKPFYGWVIVAVAVVCMMLGCGAFTGAAAAYIAPVCEQMGFAKGEFTLYRTIVSLLGALLMPAFAGVIRKLGAKRWPMRCIPLAARSGISIWPRCWRAFLPTASAS